MLCHGISGNTYARLAVYKRTRDPKLLWRALAFQQFVAQTPSLSDPALMRKPTPSPFYFYTGSYESAAALWIDLLAHGSDLTQVSMLGFEPRI